MKMKNPGLRPGFHFPELAYLSRNYSRRVNPNGTEVNINIVVPLKTGIPFWHILEKHSPPAH